MDKNNLEDQLDNWRNVEYRMDAEGVAYCFMHYSDFPEIEDEEFHRLRENLIKTITDLQELVELRIKTLSTDIGED